MKPAEMLGSTLSGFFKGKEVPIKQQQKPKETMSAKDHHDMINQNMTHLCETACTPLKVMNSSVSKFFDASKVQIDEFEEKKPVNHAELCNQNMTHFCETVAAPLGVMN